LDFLALFLTSYKKAKSLLPNEIPSFTQIYNPNGLLIAESFNTVESSLNATSHSELLAIDIALNQLGQKYLTQAILITTLEPCLQCSGSILRVKIPHIIYFLPAKKGEGITSYSTESIYLLNHFPKLELIENSEIKADFREFFREKR
jgi:tRNA(adenine34) deaminase